MELVAWPSYYSGKSEFNEVCNKISFKRKLLMKVRKFVAILIKIENNINTLFAHQSKGCQCMLACRFLVRVRFAGFLV